MSILGAAAGADLLADVEHRRLVALALADHHRAVDVEHVERLAHGVDRRLVGRVLVAVADQPGWPAPRASVTRTVSSARLRSSRDSMVIFPRSPSDRRAGHAGAARCGSCAAARAPPRQRRDPSSAPRIRASVVSWVISTIGTGLRRVAAALDQRFDRDVVVAQHGEMSASTPGWSSTIRRM